MFCMKKRVTALALAGVLCFSAHGLAAEYDSGNLPTNLVEQIRQMDEQEAKKPQESLQSRIEKIMQENPAEVVKVKELPKVAVIYINNSLSEYNKDIDKKIFTCLNKLLPKEKYELIDGTQYIEKLSDLKYMDLSMAERSDFVAVMEGSGIDYCVYMEVEPMMRNGHGWQSNEAQEATVSVPVKVIDLGTGRYIVAGKYSESHKEAPNFFAGMFGGGVSPKNVTLKTLDMVCEKIIVDVTARLPENKSV